MPCRPTLPSVSSLFLPQSTLSFPGTNQTETEQTRLHSPSKVTQKNKFISSDNRGYYLVLKLHIISRAIHVFKVSDNLLLCLMVTRYLQLLSMPLKEKDWRVLCDCQLNWKFSWWLQTTFSLENDIIYFIQRAMGNCLRVSRMEGKWICVMLEVSEESWEETQLDWIGHRGFLWNKYPNTEDRMLHMGDKDRLKRY